MPHLGDPSHFHQCAKEETVILFSPQTQLGVKMCKVCARNLVLKQMKNPQGCRLLTKIEEKVFDQSLLVDLAGFKNSSITQLEPLLVELLEVVSF